MRKFFLKEALILGGLVLCASSAFAQPAKGVKVLPMGGKCYSISDNGQWVITTEVSTSAYLYNDENGEVIELLTADIPNCEANDVSDAGVVVGNVNEMPAYYENGEWHFLEIPGDYTNGDCKSISADGSVIYGSVYTGFYFQPVIWRNNTPEIVDVLEKDPFNKLPAGGYIVDAVSAQGDRMMGRVIDSNYNWYPVLWENGVPSHKFPELFRQENGRPNTYQMTVSKFSPNGRYIAMDLIDYSISGGDHNPVIYDLREDVMHTIEGDLLCLVDDVRRSFSCTPAATLYRTAYVHENDATWAMEDWLMQRYGIDMFESGELEISGTPIAMSADGRKIVGIGNIDGNVNTYLVNLGNDIEDNIAENLKPEPTVINRDAQIIISAEAGSKINIVDLAGRTIYSQEMAENRKSIEMNAGTYIVRIIQDKEVYTFKTIVHN